MIDFQAARARLAGVVERTPLVPFAHPRFELRLKLECQQVTGAFKARGAWNHAAQLPPGSAVVTVSSGNHGKALAWAAKRRGLRATIVMPHDAYPNKIAACRDLGAEVVLAKDRFEADDLAAARARAGATMVPPFDHERTIEGQGTVGLEIVEEWPDVEAIVVPLGGGGLLAGVALACPGKKVYGVEPEGAPKMTLALERGEPVRLERLDTKIQGLCPPSVGRANLALAREHAAGVFKLPDAAILDAQRTLVREGGWVVEPAGAAGFALASSGLLGGVERVAVVLSGGNPDPDQLRAIRA